jgi:hypothetical protein
MQQMIHRPDDPIPGKPAWQDAGLRPSATAVGGRICEAPGCGTVLSIYNPNRTCWRHCLAPPRAA